MSDASTPQPLPSAEPDGHAIEQHGSSGHGRADRPATLAGVLGVLGIVYGDIGTSPLYALKTTVTIVNERQVGAGEVLGILSLVFWSLILIVTLKYVLLVLRADNGGEGGVLALMALAQRLTPGSRAAAVLGMVGIFGACLFFGDGVITPAISVLSAIEGLEVSIPRASEVVLPLSLIIIVLLFSLQYRGTRTVSRIFGPVMVIWFATIAILGVIEIVQYPGVLLALSPIHAVLFIAHHGWLAFVALGAVVLSVTGAEALYADMGHFGRKPIQLAWLGFVLPALVLNYFGQGALLIAHPSAIANPFFLLGPPWLRIPLVVISTLASIIASQAGISGAYSVTRQMMQLGYLPRMKVNHTSSTDEGQIYVPQVNRALAVGVVILMLAFRSSDALGAAYGIAVTGTFMCTCALAMVVFPRLFGWSWWASVAVFGFFFVIDAVFFAANALKLPQGGWVPLMLAIVLAVLMTTWKRGRALMLRRWKRDSLPLDSFLARLPQSRIIRVPGMAVFLTATPDYVPASLLHNLKHNKVLHERVLFVTIVNIDSPEAAPDERVSVEELAPGIHRVVLRYGFMESPNLPRSLELTRAHGIAFDGMQASYFLNREVLVRASVPKMPLWRLSIFLLMARNAVPATEFFRIPSDRVVELGVRVAV
jgi:KUP system potassium uptake protein